MNILIYKLNLLLLCLSEKMTCCWAISNGTFWDTVTTVEWEKRKWKCITKAYIPYCYGIHVLLVSWLTSKWTNKWLIFLHNIFILWFYCSPPSDNLIAYKLNELLLESSSFYHKYKCIHPILFIICR